MDTAERKEKIAQYGCGYDLLTEALAQLPREAWDFKPSPAEWSVHEILVHMGDSESMAALRVRKLIAEPGSTLMGYEEAHWADALDYKSQSAEDALEIIRLARQTTHRLLELQPMEVFEHQVTHPGYSGPYTFDQWLSIYSRHVPDHIEQMRKAVRAWGGSRRDK